MIDFSCPSCGTVYHADESQIGRKILCIHAQHGKQCEQVITIARQDVRCAISNQQLEGKKKKRFTATVINRSDEGRAISWGHKRNHLIILCSIVLLLIGIGVGVHHLGPPRVVAGPKSATAVNNNPSAASVVPNLARPDFSLPNGTEIRKRLRLKGLGDLAVENGTVGDAVVHLVDLDSRKTIRTFYIRAGMNFTERQIPPGLYGVYFSTGKDWNVEEKSFNRDAIYSQFGRNLEYRETQYASAGKIQYAHYEITLHPVFGGDVATYPSNKQAFDAMMNQPTSE